MSEHPQESIARPTISELAAALPPEEAAVLHSLGLNGPGALAERMGIELLEVSADRTVARMPVAGNTQPYGLLHGGASVVLAETVGSIAAAMFAGPGRIAIGIEVSAAHHKALRQGWVTAVASPLARNRTLATYGITLTTEDGEVSCSARLTCYLRPAY